MWGGFGHIDCEWACEVPHDRYRNLGVIKPKRPDAHERNLKTDPGRRHMELAIWGPAQVLAKRLSPAMAKAGIFRALLRWPSHLSMGASRNWRAVSLRRPNPDSMNKSRWGRVGINQYVHFDRQT